MNRLYLTEGWSMHAASPHSPPLEGLVNRASTAAPIAAPPDQPHGLTPSN